MPTYPPLPATHRHPDADPACSACGGTGRVVGAARSGAPVTVAEACPSCVRPTCPQLNTGFTCSRCGHTGWFKSTELGSVVPCVCAVFEFQNKTLGRARIPSTLRGCTFDTFESTALAAFHLRELATRYMPPQEGELLVDEPMNMDILLSGPSGSGKSHLLAATVRDLALRGVKVRYFDYPDLLAELRSMHRRRDDYQRLLNRIRQLDVIALDRFGETSRGKLTGLELEVTNQLVRGRPPELPNLYATSLPPEPPQARRRSPLTLGDLVKRDTWSQVKATCSIFELEARPVVELDEADPQRAA